MGRRRRRVVKIIKKKLPTVFVCPKCGEESVRASPRQADGRATVKCGACGLSDTFPVATKLQLVDIYCLFTDRFYGTTGIAVRSTPEPVPVPVEVDVGAIEPEAAPGPELQQEPVSSEPEEHEPVTQGASPSEIFFESEGPPELSEDSGYEESAPFPPSEAESKAEAQSMEQPEASTGKLTEEPTQDEPEAEEEIFPIEEIKNYPLVAEPSELKRPIVASKKVEEQAEESQSG